MATRYWVGGNGNWDAATTTNWSATSGGAGGASAPTATDDVVFDTGSGGTATSYYFPSIITGATCRNISISRASSTLGVFFQRGASGSQTLAISGNFEVLTTLCAFAASSGSGTLIFKFTATTSGKSVYTPTNTPLCSLEFNGVGGVWSITSVFGIATSGTDTVTLTNGELNLNSTFLTTGNFSSSNTNVRVLTFGSGDGRIILVGTTFDCTISTNLTVNNGATSQIYFLGSAGTKLFAGGSKTWGVVGVPGTSVTVTGSNTFSGTFYTDLFVPMTLTFAAGSTQTFLSGIDMRGTGTGNRIVINSSVLGTQATLSQANGLPLTVNYANIKDLNATGGQSWVATNSVDSGNNTGWAFPVASRGSMMMFF